MNAATKTRVTLKTTADALAYLESIEQVPGYPVTPDGQSYVIPDECGRCGGSGRIDCYGHVEGGVCFACGGRRSKGRVRHETIIAFAKKARREELAEQRRERKLAEKEEKMLEGQRRWCEEQGLGRITFAERDAYLKAEREAQLADQAIEAFHVGTVGERRSWDVVVEAVHSWDGAYGVQFLYRLTDSESGQTLVWKTATGFYFDTPSGDQRGARKGDHLRIAATVKAHGDYKGVAQTAITRTKLVAVLREGSEEERRAS